MHTYIEYDKLQDLVVTPVVSIVILVVDIVLLTTYHTNVRSTIIMLDYLGTLTMIRFLIVFYHNQISLHMLPKH